MVGGILLGQRDAAGLTVRSQHLAALVLGAKVGHHAVPKHARGAQLRNLHEEIHANREEEGQAPRELVDIEPRCDAVAHIFGAVGDRTEEHTSELQSLMRISYAVYCLKKK